MFATTAYAQVDAGGASGGNMLMQFLPLIALVVLFYFLLIRPQQRRAKQHAALLAAIRRGDTVVLSSGIVGKVIRVEDNEVGVEIANGVTTKVVKSMISDVRVKGAPAPANDAKV